MVRAMVVSLFLLITGAYAHEAKHHVMGIVTAVDSSHIELKTQEGKTFKVALPKETHYMKGKTHAALSDVKVGVRAVVHYNGEDQPTAVKVELPSEK